MCNLNFSHFFKQIPRMLTKIRYPVKTKSLLLFPAIANLQFKHLFLVVRKCQFSTLHILLFFNQILKILTKIRYSVKTENPFLFPAIANLQFKHLFLLVRKYYLFTMQILLFQFFFKHNLEILTKIRYSMKKKST